MNEKNKLNIGCGRDYRETWINIDISPDVEAEYHLDIRTERLPFPDDSADYIYISGVLEQILQTEHLIFVMNECHRVLKPGSIMEVVVPNARHAIAHQDPMDVRKFTRETFTYFMTNMKQWEHYGSVYGFKGWSRLDIRENRRHLLIVKLRK